VALLAATGFDRGPRPDFEGVGLWLRVFCWDFFRAGAVIFFGDSFLAGTARFFGEAAFFDLDAGEAAFFDLGAAVMRPGLWGFFEEDFFALVALSFRDAGEPLLALVIRTLIVSSNTENEPAPRLTLAHTIVYRSFISTIYRQVKKIAFAPQACHRDRNKAKSTQRICARLW
jgi:hypothetical protein